MEPDNPEKLLSEFPFHSYEDWKQAATALLKGRPFEKTLVTPTCEGFDLQPIYTRDVLAKLSHVGEIPGEGSRVRGSAAAGYLESGWKISQEVTGPTAADANAVVLEQIRKGQDELNIRPDKATRCGLNPDTAKHDLVATGGVSISRVDDIQTLLKGIDLEQVPVYLQGRQAAPSLYALLMAYSVENGIDPAVLRGCIGMDPVGSLAETGTATSEFEDVLDVVASLIQHVEQSGSGLQVLDVQGHCYHNSGASSTQEMAAVLAASVLYLRAMSKRGIPVERVVPRMRLSVSVGGNYFIEIAKLRAMRLLWSRIMEAFDVPEGRRSVQLHARTGLWNKTVLDPYVNMLRTTTEAFSAVVGGCDSLHIGPFDEVIRDSNAFSRRIAFNIHSILAEECDMRRVIDPAGGSWAVESLTDEMAKSAWNDFQSIEADGGMIEVLLAGTFQHKVEQVLHRRLKNIQQRRDVIVGTNAYPNADEKMLPPADIDYPAVRKKLAETISSWKNKRDNSSLFTVLDGQVSVKGTEMIDIMITAAKRGATLAELQASAGLGTLLDKAKPLHVKRAAAEFEELRMAAKQLERDGRQPIVHQLNIGPSRNYRARADWTSSFFQAGGFKVLNDDDYESWEDAVEALGRSGAKIAVVTSDDDTYTEVVAPLSVAIRNAGEPVTLYVAGAPGDKEAEWNNSGVDGYVNIRVNNYEINRHLLVSLGADL